MNSRETLPTLDLPLEDLPGYLMRMASSMAMIELAESLEKFHLRAVDASVLIHVGDHPGCRQREVGERFNILSANLTPLISRLEKRGLIRRKPIDGRTNGLHLTAKGRKTKDRAWKAILTYEDALIKRVPAKLREPFVQALQHLAKVT